MLKQVIVMRTDLNMRKGKMCAQAAHSSTLSSLNMITKRNNDFIDWFDTGMTKIVVGVSSYNQLMELALEADKLGVPNYLVIDKESTEFNGAQTVTCAAFGPYKSETIDVLTGHLKLI